MNVSDISKLSYKELQALALRYRVPGNIKKNLLVKVLQAAKGGNENEVGRLLHDLKQNRKRRMRKTKSRKLGITSTPMHSPNYVMADDYYCVQQPPYQWIGAEEEIMSREEENRIPHYEEFRQFLLKKIQREYQAYDTNNNQIEESAIIDLRTPTNLPNVHNVAVDNENYAKSSIITVNTIDTYTYSSDDHVEYQILEDSNKNVQGSILLKKMLQAPVGANLGEIASPIPGSYQTWSVEQYQPNDQLDNSDTLTAESESNGNEDNFTNNRKNHDIVNYNRNEYFLNEPNFRNMEDINQQISSALTDDNINQYRSYSSIDVYQSHQNWITANSMETIDTNCIDSGIQLSKELHTVRCNNEQSDTADRFVNSNNFSCHYSTNETEPTCETGRNSFYANPYSVNQYYDSNISNIQPDSTSYCAKTLNKHSEESNIYYIQNMYTLTDTQTEQTFSTVVQQVPSGDTSTLSYQHSYANTQNESNIAMNETNFEQARHGKNVAAEKRFIISKDNVPAKVQFYSNGILDPFWPKCSSQNPSDVILDNILNLCFSKHVDYTKLDQTSCVYCYAAPVVTQQPVSSNSACSQSIRLVPEQRQHSFSSSWLLYNDTSTGMRMANLQGTNNKETSENEAETAFLMSSGHSNSDAKESIEESEDSINDVWIHSYTNCQTPTPKELHVCEDMNVETTDSLFAAINTESQVA